MRVAESCVLRTVGRFGYAAAARQRPFLSVRLRSRRAGRAPQGGRTIPVPFAASFVDARLRACGRGRGRGRRALQRLSAAGRRRYARIT